MSFKFVKHKYVDTAWFYKKRSKARYKGIIFNVTLEYIEALLVAQEWKCALTHVPLYISSHRPRGKGRFYKCTASMDRLDCTKGYVKGNIRWVHKTVNYMRGIMPDKELRRWCRLILNPKKIVKHL